MIATERTPQHERAALRAAGVNPWLALIAPALLTVPFLAYHAISQRRIDILALFTLAAIVVGTATSLVTGDPRTLLVRDSWIFGRWACGCWPRCSHSIPSSAPLLERSSP